MAPRIKRVAFTESHFDQVQGFHCGSEHYEQQVSDWLKGPFGSDSASTSINKGKQSARVYLYYLDDQGKEALLGYGALVHANWNWKQVEDPRIPITLIIWFGIDKRFQGEPRGAEKDDKYAYQAFEDLLSVAYADRATRPTVTLLVDTENTKAIKFYEYFDFSSEGMMTYPDNGHLYQRMYMILDDAAHDKAVTAAQDKRKK